MGFFGGPGLRIANMTLGRSRVSLDLDARFPVLSALALSHRRGLNRRADSLARPADHFLGLSECCWEARHGRRGVAIGPMNYLATLDEFVCRFSSDVIAVSRVWKKLTTGGESSFLDTVAEAAWALHFLALGLSPRLDVRFDATNPDSKDADIVLVTGDDRLWLDVKNVDFTKDGFLVSQTRLSGVPRPKPEVVREAILERASREYQGKFGKAQRRGNLPVGEAVGLLLCGLKSEPIFIRAVTNGPEQLALPSRLRNFAPALCLVVAHRLAPRSGLDVLMPVPLVTWIDDAACHILGWIERGE